MSLTKQIKKNARALCVFIIIASMLMSASAVSYAEVAPDVEDGVILVGDEPGAPEEPGDVGEQVDEGEPADEGPGAPEAVIEPEGIAGLEGEIGLPVLEEEVEEEDILLEPLEYNPAIPTPSSASLDAARNTMRVQHSWLTGANFHRWVESYTGTDGLSLWYTDDGTTPSKTNGTRMRINPTMNSSASNGLGTPQAWLLDYKGGTTYTFICYQGDDYGNTYTYTTALNAPRFAIDNNIDPAKQNTSLALTNGLYKRSDLAGGIRLFSDTPTAEIYYLTEPVAYDLTYCDFAASSIDSTSAANIISTGTLYTGPISAAALTETNGIAIRAAVTVPGSTLTPQASLLKLRATDDSNFITLKADKDGNYLMDIDAFIAQLSIDEKVMMCGGTGADPVWLLNGYSYPYESNNGGTMRVGGPAGGTKALPRFNIPSLVLADGPAGVRMWKNVTVWMSPAGMGASWNQDLIYKVGERFAAEGEHYAVDICLSPMINIQRNPVGGRNFEFYSEDPYLTGYTTGAYVSGMQDNGLSGNLKVIGLNDYETGRSSGGAFATERTIMEVYLRAHEIGLRESGAHTFMTGYNRINSVRCDSNKWMITDVVRGMWGFKGFVMTDWSSDPGVVSLEAQVDMIQSAARTLNTYRTWVNADVAERMPILDRSVKNVLGVLVQTFAFQGAYGVLQPDGTYADGFRIDGRPTVGLTSQDIGQRNLDFGGSDIQKESAVVNKQLADEAIVLLRNDNNVLPLDGDEKVALVSSRLAWKDFFDPRWYGDSASIGDMLLQGTGSAQARFSNSTQDYSMTLVEALNDRGFDVVDWKIDFGALGGNNQAFIDAFENNKPAQGGKKYLYSPECALGTSAEAAAYTAANNLPLATAQANAKAAAEAAAAAADVCVYVITRVAGEDGDLNATTYQVQPKELLVYYEYETAFKNAGKPIIALINVGGTMSTTMIRGGYVSVGTGANNVVRTTTGANAILDVWNPGTAGNEAIADILRGAVNPSGRLAQTFIVNFEDSPSIKMFTDYNNQTDKATFPTYPGNGYNNNAYYADGVYVGHRYFESNPEMYASMVAFPFGYGLSYTTFEFSNLKLDKEIFYKDTDKLSATVTVKNTGTVAGKEVVQLYLSADTWQEEGRPKNELRAYGKTDMLQPGESQTITLSITLNDLQYYDDGTPDSFIGHPETRAFWSASNLPIYGRGKGWTVADDTGFTITIRTNGSDGSLPNQPIDGLKDHFVYSAEKTPPVMLVSASTSAKQFISIVETSKNSRIWVLSFTVTETYSNGEVKVVPYSISLNANNANVDGSYNLGPYTLKYDIKGNASNIKEFSIVNVNNGYFTVGFRLYDGLNSIGYTQYVKSGDSIDWESVEGKYKFFGGKKWEDIEMWVLDAGGKQFTDLNAPITGNIVLTPKFYFVDVTGISMQESARMITGATLELTATITPFNADNKQLTWSSSDEAVATVDQTGIVTAIGDGTVTITVLAANGVVSASCDIIVTEAGAFTVVGKEIIGPDGEPYVMKGINVQGPGAWISRGLTQDLELICDVWKFNSIRLICGTKWNSFASGYNNNETDNMDTIVQKFTDKGIVVMIDNHDYTSIFPRADDTSYVNSEGHTIPSFTEFKAWWVNVANKYKDNPYVWFNIMNEPGGNARNEAGANNWLNYHDQAVEAVRNTGAKNIIVLDDYFWGQANGYQGGSTSWDSAVIRKGPDLNAKYDNLVFSLHVYEQWRDAYGSGIQNGEQRFLAYFNDAWDLGMCVVLGEYGVMRSGSEIANQENAVKNMFNAAIPNNVGRSCYSWFDTALPLTTASSRAGWGIDKLDGTMPTNLTYIGDLVWRDNYDTLSVPIGADPGPGPVGENLIKNADFSNGNTSWNLWGSGTGIQSGAAVPSPIPNNKTFALHIPTGSGLGVNQTGIPLEPGKTYRLTGWGICSTTPSGTNNMDISLQYANGTSGSINTYRTIQFRETVWTQKSVEFTMPAQFSQCEISVYKSSAGFEFWCTDLWLVEVT